MVDFQEGIKNKRLRTSKCHSLLEPLEHSLTCKTMKSLTTLKSKAEVKNVWLY